MGRLDGAGEAVTLRAARRLAGFGGCAAAFLFCTAHVGSPDTFFEGPAGPYAVRVIIRAPQVIPARAEVIVRVNGDGVRRVTAAPYIWNGGEKGAPPADELVRVPGDTTLWSVQLWIMAQGSYSVRVRVEGARGSGTLIVPFTAVATSVLGMDRALGIGLSAFGLFLVVGLLTIVGAGAREATLEPDAEPDAARSRRAWLARGVAAVIITGTLVGGRAWWKFEDGRYASGVYRNTHGTVTVRDDAGRRMLRLVIDSVADARRWPPLVPDHGKLMHLFLIKDGDLGAMAHLHPLPIDSMTFETALPALPAGRYHVYADIVHENGFAETVVGNVEVGGWEGGRVGASDPDDAAFVGAPSGLRVPITDGTTLTWLKGDSALVAGQDARLHFKLRDAQGMPITVEPYLGMAAHAVVVASDQSVFVHLHPMGTAPVAAQRALEAWTPADSTRGALRARLEREVPAMVMDERPSGDLSFPYAFPKAGRYVVWVQFKRDGEIRTAVFGAVVKDSR